MPRIEENNKMLKSLKNARCSNPDSAMIASILMDISQSLAIISDCVLDEWQNNRAKETRECCCDRRTEDDGK